MQIRDHAMKAPVLSAIPVEMASDEGATDAIMSKSSAERGEARTAPGRRM
jgi:hypothetical protein